MVSSNLATALQKENCNKSDNENDNNKKYRIMERGKITIENGVVSVTLTDGSHTVWMSVWEIARLFGVMTPTVTTCIKAILKYSVLWEADVFHCHHYDNGNSVELYNLDMITALAFRISSPNADVFRGWLMKCITVHANVQPTVVIWSYTGGTVSLN
jgi:hypothetical protein